MANGTNGHNFWPTWQSNRLFTLLLTIFLAYAIVWLGTLVKLNLEKAERVGVAETFPANISVEGVGEVTGTPDIAQAALGLETRGVDVPTAQRENTATMNALVAKLRELGVSSEDVQTTNYTVYPNYRYEPNTGANLVDGYVVSQQVSVKIRDLAKIGAVLAAAGDAGLNQVSGLTFTIDDPETLQAEARQEALRKVREKAEGIATSLGVRLGRVTNFSEALDSSAPPYGPYPLALGRGGGGGVPDIQTGSLDVTIRVSVTYEIE